MNKKSAKNRSTKVATLKRNLQFILMQHVQGRNFRPSTTEELLLRLAILPEQSELFTELLEQLEEEGLLQRTSSGAWMPVQETTSSFSPSQEKKSGKNYREGIISFHPRGFAFVRLDDVVPATDVFIPPSQTLNALPSDHVCIEITGQDRKGPEGRVVHIVQRGRNSIHGIVLESSDGKRSKVSVLVPALSQHHLTIKLDPGVEVEKGDRVLLKVLEWEKDDYEVTCSLMEVLGHIDDPSCDIDIAISEFGLKREFPSEVLDEALGLGQSVKPEDLQGRRDLRATPCITIDPDTAKDYDDAISIEKKDNVFHLGVHIADVAHYVKWQSLLDKEAKSRCNSTYFPGYCLPMLPSELSNELCSLKADVERLCVSVLMRFDQEGVLLDYEICRSVIKSAKRLTYRQAMAIIDKKALSPHADMIACMVELCEKLKKHKADRGSIEFSLPEAVILCDNKGHPQTTDFVEYDITHQMIEEFMVKANEVVATHLSEQNRACIYRIHESPLQDDLRDFFQAARYYGHQFAKMPTQQECHAFFQSIKDQPYASQLATAYIRSMRLAQYNTKNVGHYGLGLTHYCHFTSPIRRYSDLTIIRTLFDEPRDLGEELEAVAQQCCDKERNSAKAEGSVLELKKLRYLKKLHDEDADKVWKAMVTKVKPFGVTFEIEHLLLEGFIHISELCDGYVRFDEMKQFLREQYSGLVLRAGSQIELELVSVDLITRQSKWKLDDAFMERTAQETLERRRLRALARGEVYDEENDRFYAHDQLPMQQERRKAPSYAVPAHNAQAHSRSKRREKEGKKTKSASKRKSSKGKSGYGKSTSPKSARKPKKRSS